jgi:TnpA family transposase
MHDFFGRERCFEYLFSIERLVFVHDSTNDSIRRKSSLELLNNRINLHAVNHTVF